MDLIRWYLYCQLFCSKWDFCQAIIGYRNFPLVVGCLVNSENPRQPQISQTELSNDILRLECSVIEPVSGLKMHFYCVTQKRRCFENCKSIDSSGMNINCTEKFETDKYSIFYDISKSTMPTGNYYCQYRSLDSSYLTHVQKKPLTTTTAAVSLGNFSSFKYFAINIIC